MAEVTKMMHTWASLLFAKLLPFVKHAKVLQPLGPRYSDDIRVICLRLSAEEIEEEFDPPNEAENWFDFLHVGGENFAASR